MALSMTSIQLHDSLRAGGCASLIASLAAFLCVAFVADRVCSQMVVQAGPPKIIDAKMQATIIDSVSAAMQRVYVFPDVAKETEKYVRKQYRAKAYEGLHDLVAFLQQLTVDMASIAHDKHLAVMYIAGNAPGLPNEGPLSGEDLQRETERLAALNYQFERIENLPGNVGYLKLNEFVPAEMGGESAIAAMNFLGHSDAVIIDLRDNFGGDPSMIQLISSYFFDQPVHLNDFYVRRTGATRQFWTTADVRGPRLSKADLYVLTSSSSFSAAEEFAYNLQQLKRATIVGEVTGGGAHPVSPIFFPDLDITAFVPYGRAVNPISGTNWEGVGVKPDIEISRDDAYDVAYSRALEGLRDKAKDPARKAALVWICDDREANSNPIRVDSATLASYVGTYGARTITIESGELFYQRQGRPKTRLLPLVKDKFSLDGMDAFRIQFVRDGGKATELVGMYKDGRSDRTARTQ